MSVKITRNAAKVLREEIDKPENEGKFLRVFITHSHGDHAHYGMQMDEPTDKDEVFETDKDIKVIIEKGVELLDGVRIDYFYVPEEGFMISNPTKGNHGDH
ncbi:Fe-S cluster assembly iron-binding protein IscA [Paenibacillus taihuensis]|uniref:Fe-S cluster assembly iron-binding protein IscA n=1 Tax=Paenibacillus taihuensis TaxID=1156355 RepID=A0A3D9RL25_9BACL|nr:iron-sulfur cluster assembly accessory protein [Paenibacillus taihuensis]REE80248.1 Fe-S cluster assembly iron-binding protein IscA [Paenibacillus taihuensis]